MFSTDASKVYLKKIEKVYCRKWRSQVILQQLEEFQFFQRSLFDISRPHNQIQAIQMPTNPCKLPHPPSHVILRLHVCLPDFLSSPAPFSHRLSILRQGAVCVLWVPVEQGSFTG